MYGDDVNIGVCQYLALQYWNPSNIPQLIHVYSYDTNSEFEVLLQNSNIPFWPYKFIGNKVGDNTNL